jgi:hypothetical protein
LKVAVINTKLIANSDTDKERTTPHTQNLSPPQTQKNIFHFLANDLKTGILSHPLAKENTGRKIKWFEKGWFDFKNSARSTK